ncbi:transposase [Streptomyces netropsis]
MKLSGGGVACVAGDGGKPRDRRQVFDGIWWRARTDPPWRDAPERYGP